MSGDLLDTIDNVLHDYETSPDAMRWTPDPVPRPPTTAEIFQSFTRTAQQIAEVYGRAANQMVQAMAKWIPLINDLQRQLEAARAAERQSAMHSAYRRRQKRRSR